MRVALVFSSSPASQDRRGLEVAAPAPEIHTGILGIAAAAGVIYLTKRFKRS